MEICYRGIMKPDTTSNSVWNDEAFLSSILFAVHPIHVEAVSGIVGRADVLAAIFFLLTFNLYDKIIVGIDYTGCTIGKYFYFLICVISTIVATLSKETGITVLVRIYIHPCTWKTQASLYAAYITYEFGFWYITHVLSLLFYAL